MSCLPAWEDAGKQPDYTTLISGSGLPTSTLDSLRDELGDAAVERFLVSYLALLEQRITEIGRLINEGSYGACITLLLTLETSSHMVGADELSLRSAALRLAMAHRQSDIGVLYAEMARAGVFTRNLLSR